MAPSRCWLLAAVLAAVLAILDAAAPALAAPASASSGGSPQPRFRLAKVLHAGWNIPPAQTQTHRQQHTQQQQQPPLVPFLLENSNVGSLRHPASDEPLHAAAAHQPGGPAPLTIKTLQRSIPQWSLLSPRSLALASASASASASARSDHATTTTTTDNDYNNNDAAAPGPHPGTDTDPESPAASHRRRLHQQPLGSFADPSPLGANQQRLPVSPRFKSMLVPDHTDPETVLNFARFTYDAYYEPDDKAWTPVPGWNVTGRFGWRDGGIRGYLFIDETEEILVIVIKGTSLSTPIGSGPTAKLDKLNDNMMFSCCCAKAGWEWKAICDCPMTGNQCSTSCLLRESNFDGSYYNLAQTIYLAVKEWFPKHTNIWMAGHSLGGALAALVALTNDLPSFSFESPGDLLFATRLGLVPDVVDPTEFLGSLPIYHFGNDGDPIFLGICTGVTSSCYWLEYALETKCHIGHECMYTEKMSKKMWPWSATASASASDQSKAAIGPAAVRDSARSQLHRLGNPHSLPSTHTLNDGKVDAEGSIQFHSIDFVIKRFLEPATSVPKCVTKPQCLKSECPTWSFVD